MKDNSLRILLLVLLVSISMHVDAQFNSRDSLLRFSNRGIWSGKRTGGKNVSEKKVATTKKSTKERGTSKKSSVKKKSKKDVSKRANTKKEPRIDSVTYAPKYSLGDRVIMRGDYGPDVKKVADILVRNLFIDEKDIPYTSDGQVLYDGELVKAVRLFQKVEGLFDDGMIGETTVKKLRKRGVRN